MVFLQSERTNGARDDSVREKKPLVREKNL
jgi:hypothetical protein